MAVLPLYGAKVTFAYNTLIKAHASSSPSLAFSLFSNMRRAGVSPDHFTFPFVLKACSRLQMGQDLHSLIVKLGFDTNIYVQNALINFYGCCGSVHVAFNVFEEMLARDLVSWSSMIASLANNGLAQEALALFRQMQLDGDVKPDEVTMLSVVSAISNLGVLKLGMWIDAYISRNRLKLTVSLGTSLINMYSRCGSVDDSIRVFDKMPERNVLTWTALINGLAVHGRCREALKGFYEMRETDLRPDHITFTSVLVACSHGGLVDDGWKVFKSIKTEYGMEPTVEHYGCMVDLLGRAGKLHEAFEFIEKMPYKPNAIIWRTLLGACVNHNNLALAEEAKEKINQLEPHHDGDYVLLSNAYAEVGRYSEKTELRNSMQEKKISKKPGYSLLTVEEEIHEFVSGDSSHPESEEIRKLLVCIIDSLRVEGYTPHTSNVFHDIEEEEKEHSLSYHSEKLAVAFALLRFKDRRTIRIMKNVRTCRDCHDFLKHVSGKFDKEIVVRDRNRFHRFRNGTCSCHDYW
ncbi:pentatricopeptide repeat-containing protein At4g21065 [Manihot esculenta]|uniref:DYW domain-containing protein n=1 Tax=Manihot esculenta TaxID=3983 RepID=A0A2C9V094_MANES|nr:pentatricopeptide repeat-containing protein At4g21065 [Manihot esculenta]OAY36879.1 hypothetical protein MANES_11G056600v8 [Manihot esculenta]